MAVTLTNDFEFKQQLAAHDKVAVKFFADWCGSCKLFAPKFKRMSESEEFSCVTFLDVNAEQNPETRALVGVSNLPFFAVFKNGELVKGDFTAKEETVTEMIRSIL